ncbi:MAG: hypothetical protein H6732_08660 [Alphaproteobacteria bacterium]|nr:hypothetical protein [Alphaproteobacteria bacterium]
MASGRGWAGVWLVGLLTGCPKNVISPDDEALAAALEAADRAWAARGTAGLDPVGAALDTVPASRAEVPEVLWRRARWHVARGHTQDEDAEARREHERGRDVAMRCVLVAPGLTGALRGGTLPAALPALEVSRLPCAAWAGVAWVRADQRFDPETGTLDVPAVEALLSAGRRAPPPSGPAAAYGDVLWAAAHPVDPGAGEQALEALASAAAEPTDDAWVRWEDLVRVMPRPKGTAPGRAPATPEERASVRRLTGGLLYRPSNLERLDRSAPGGR